MARPERFEGRIGRTVADSEPYFDDGPHPGEDAPDVAVILLDDTGFAQFGCYGSDIDTPHVDGLAAAGVQFTNFHTTPLCSPTRASLLTGRYAHAVGMRAVSNFRTGFPNMLGHITNHATTLAEVLRAEGYTTFCAGKWHLAPMEQCSAAGPYDQWPLGRGFNRFYGFLDGETDQFHPELVCDNHPVDPPGGPEDGYHLSEDLVDRALGMISDSTGIRPDRPCFTFLSFGATHAPHQAPPDYLAKYRGAFDEGWDVLRRRWYERQLELGVIPEGTRLAPRNPGVDAWDDLPEAQQRLAARLQEAFAAYLDHTDVQIGRFVEGLRALGRLDNTLLMVLADNGASQEGGPFGVLHEMKFFNGILEEPAEALARLDDIGGPHSHANYPWGWAQAGNTPFRWYKQNTHEGGVHVPLIVHWPARFGRAGHVPDPPGQGPSDPKGDRLRRQFVDVADVAPTIYELVGITPPQTFGGIEQLPVTGRSFASVLDDASAPATNTLQLYEMLGSRALVAGEWKAVCKHTPGADYETEPWELYRLATDASECVDLAESEPDRLAEMVELWWREAERHGVLPLDDRLVELFAPRFRPRSPHPPDRIYRYRPPMSPISPQAAAPVGGRDFDLVARVERDIGDEGVLYANGTENAGVSVFVQADRLVVDYNAFGDHVLVTSGVPVPVGASTLTVRGRRGEGRRGSVELDIDGQACGAAELPLYMRIISSVGTSIGHDHGSAVSERYHGPFPFTGTLHEVMIRISPRRADGSAEASARTEMARQ